MAEVYPIYDAHNHLQDERLESGLGKILENLKAIGLKRCVVNGTREEDWPKVAELGKRYDFVIPSFGLHPWHVRDVSDRWKDKLLEYLNGKGAIGEIGLDKWVQNVDFSEQEKVFRWQLQQAAERDLPASIHCLKAWGRLQELLQEGPRPNCGFLLHSYGGPLELVQPLAKLGAYFSISGYFAHDRKAKQQEIFKQAPLERLLIETDAPDMQGPEQLQRYVLGSDGKLNHPANIIAVYEFVAELRGMRVVDLAAEVENNFTRLFGRLLR